MYSNYIIYNNHIYIFIILATYIEFHTVNIYIYRERDSVTIIL